jgi:hypothetical protein
MVDRVDDPFLTWINLADLWPPEAPCHAPQRQARCGLDRWSDHSLEPA